MLFMIYDLQSNVSLLTTKSFGANSTVKSIRSSPTKSIEWEERLKRLAEVISGSDKEKWPERVKEALDEGFKDLSAVLIQISTSKRPLCIFRLINAFAIALVKLQQWRSINGYEEGDELVTDLVHKTLGYWLNARAHFNDWDRAWAHTRTVLVDMLRNITSMKTLINEGDELVTDLLHKTLGYWLNARAHFNDWDRAWAHTRTVLVDMLRNITSMKTLINVKHLISSMLTELLSYTAKEESYAYGVYASEQLEHLESVLTQQLYHVGSAR
uniref:Dilute domain-containing protein n=1 Tax=Ascaris lumbricoides TaxID=6252 RepID=A0A0M3I234_ASCLU